MKRFILVMLLCTGIAQASPLQDLQKVGDARLKVWFWDIYESSLYTASGQYNEADYPIALQIDYLRDISSEDLVEATVEQWQKQGLDDKRMSQWIERITELWPDIRKGDQLIFRVDDNQKGRFYYNQQPLGEIEDTGFSAAFLGIWLSPDTEYPKLRQKLIQRSDQ
jgi:hypothetical protein